MCFYGPLDYCMLFGCIFILSYGLELPFFLSLTSKIILIHVYHFKNVPAPVLVVQ